MTAATLPLDIDGLDVSVEICPWRILHSDSPLQSALNMGGLLSVKWYCFCAKPFSILGADARLLSHTPTFRHDREHTTHYLESCLETS
jgi:hypothetical protein